MAGDRLLLKGLLLSIVFHLSIVIGGVLIGKYFLSKKNFSLEVDLASLRRNKQHKPGTQRVLGAEAFNNQRVLFLYNYAGGNQGKEDLLTLDVKDRRIRHAMELLKKKWMYSGGNSPFIIGLG